MRRKSVALALCWSLFWAAEAAAGDVKIYAALRTGEFGRALSRDEVKKFPVSVFEASRTLAVADPDGILTAVVLDSRVVEALTSYLTDFHERRLGGAWFWMQEAGGRKIFTYYDDALGLKFSFSAQRPDKSMLAMITGFYRGDAKTRRDVAEHYQKNYVIRIHSAENIIEPWLDVINFEEAFVMASLIGDRKQELWGIHDGAGLLENLPGLVAAKTSLPLYQYRLIEKNEAEYLGFIYRVNAMQGRFARNLFFAAMNEFKTGPYFDFQLPEEFAFRRQGKPEELVLLYTDVLVRMGFEARLLAAAKDSEAPSLVVVFREEGRGNWSALTEKAIFPDVAADWRRIAGLLMPGGTVWYHEMDYERIFRERQVYEVPPGSWSKSR